MTREKQIKQAALERNCDGDFDSNDGLNGFVEGAHWADEHPKSPWISVEERLPEITYPILGESVFVFVHVVNKDTGSEWIELPAKYNERFHDWQTNDFTWIGKRSGVVTHWMPIPTIPQNN